MLPTQNRLFLHFLLIQRSPLGINRVRSASIDVINLSFFKGSIDHAEVESTFHHVQGKFCLFFSGK